MSRIHRVAHAIAAIMLCSPRVSVAQAGEPRTLAGAEAAARAWLLKPGNAMEHYRLITTDSVPKSELTCRSDRPTCWLTDGFPRVRIRAWRTAADSGAVTVDSVEVEIATYTNGRSVVDGGPFMDRGGYTYMYNYVGGKWVRGRLLSGWAS